MAGVVKRQDGGKYRIWYIDEAGKRKWGTGHTDKRASQQLANRFEEQARLVKEGFADRSDRTRRIAENRPVAAHIEDWRLSMLARGDKPNHSNHMAGAVTRVLASAGVASVAEPKPDLIELALGRMTAAGRSPRTRNHALSAIKAFFRWLYNVERIREVPRGVAKITKLSEESDRKLIRRALSRDEVNQLIEVTRMGPDRVATRAGRGQTTTAIITGPDRAMLYDLAAGTGFRANELRSLTLESFHLDTADPMVTIHAGYSKDGHSTEQPIGSALAERLRDYLRGRGPGRVFVVPEKTAKMIRADIAAAGLEYTTSDGTADFHSLRATYITELVRSGLDADHCRKLARHSDVRLTLQRYAKSTPRSIRDALEGGGKKSA